MTALVPAAPLAASSTDAAPPRRLVGRPFAAGTSGNPRGRKAPGASLAAYVQKQSKGGKELVDQLLLFVRGDAEALGVKYVSPQWRLEALGMLLDRGFGKPVQPTEVTGADGGPIEHALSVAPQSIDYRASVQRLAPSEGDEAA